MTTRLTRPVRREIATPRHGALIVTIAPEGLYYREKGRRTPFLLPHGVAFQRAVDLHVREQRAAKAATRKAKRV